MEENLNFSASNLRFVQYSNILSIHRIKRSAKMKKSALMDLCGKSCDHHTILYYCILYLHRLRVPLVFLDVLGSNETCNDHAG